MDIMAMQKWAFKPDLPEDIAPIRDLLVHYSKISPESVDAHLIRIRDESWKVLRTPFIGRWKFLRLTNTNDPCYMQVRFRLGIPCSRDVFLDLGCGFGQALRQLRADGVDGSQLIGLDEDAAVVNAGYSLFQDLDKLGALFFIGDITDPHDTRLRKLNGKVTIIHAGSFLHLFTWTQQIAIGKRLVDFLRPGTQNALIYGRHAGTTAPQDVAACGSSPYLHNQDSFQRLWGEIGELTKTQWKVEVEPTGSEISRFPGSPKNVQSVNFTVYQIP